MPSTEHHTLAAGCTAGTTLDVRVFEKGSLMKKMIWNTFLATCVVFTAMMVISLMFAYIFSGPSEGLNLTVSILIASIICAVLQAVWLSATFIKTMHYGLRLGGFAASLFIFLILIGLLFHWIPSNPWAILSFALIFAILFLVIFAGYSLYFKKTAGSYNQALKKYRNSQPTKESGSKENK